MIDYAPDVKELLSAMNKINNVTSPGLHDLKLLSQAKKKYPKEYEEFKNYYINLNKMIQVEKKKLNRIRRIGHKFWDTID